MIDKSYEPGAVETRIYKSWVESGAFAAGSNAKVGQDAYSIVIPPPNVTGSLHIGHAFNNTVQDIMVRYERMRGKDVLWQPGLDHAGIATQMIVERQLAERQEPGRQEMGREKFLEKIWEWKAESGGTIFEQLRRLGASCDWSRERFTMGENGQADEQMVRAVTKVFVELHKKGLIYREKRLVNWHPALQTAISDLEVENLEVKGKMWHLRYPLADGQTYEHAYIEVEGETEEDTPTRRDWTKEDGTPTGFETRAYIVVATTRPETMLGDTAVAVNPSDERYKHLVGKFVDLPLSGRRIPIVADDHADPEQGSGAVKITPAHDFNDFEVGQRHDLPQINIFTVEAKINDLAPEAYRGLDRFKAREQVLQDMDALGAVDQIETKKIMVPHDEKTKLVIIEPFLTDQWWVNAEVLAKPALKSVREGRTKFVPQKYENTYFAWLENIRPWCISRQLWWGHQIPAWYGPDMEVFVALNETDALAAAENHYGAPTKLRRDPDVLDTWFSSALWPFSTMGWPDDTAELKKYYPTDVVVTGFDIIFFWVARMMMMGLEFLGEEPFHTVYMHELVRDAKGQKMSKVKGNVVNPLELIDKYGADASRFTFAAMAAPGAELKLSMQRVEGYRNFVTKIWNAARFLEMNECTRVEGYNPKTVHQPLNQWIIGATACAVTSVEKAFEEHRYNEAANAAYDFVWGTFCDWYVELSKPVMSGEDADLKAETRATAAFVLDQILKLLHPFMPFVTEELWAQTGTRGPARAEMLVVSSWPELAGLEQAGADAEISWLLDVISGIRSVRSEMNVPGGARIELRVVGADDVTQSRISLHRGAIERLARISDIELVNEVPGSAAQLLVGEAIFALPLGEVIDLTVEKARLAKDIAKLEDEMGKIDKKLSNAQFVAKAPDHVVADQRQRHDDLGARRDRVAAALDRLS